MSVAALTFGSCGDISTLLQMAFAVRRAIVEAKGGSDDIQSTIAGIDSFVLAIQGVRDQLEKADGIPVSVQNGIEHGLGVCTQALQRVQNRIEANRRSYEKRNGSRGWRTYWALCLWTALGGKAEIASMMKQLADQVLVLQTFVDLLHCTSLDKIETRQDTQGGDISEILTRVTSLRSRMYSDVPFTFFDHEGHAVEPMLKMSWANFADFWEEYDFPTKAEDISHNKIHEVVFSVARPCGFVLFDLYIYDDPQAFRAPTALISPVYFYEKEGDVPRLWPQLSRLVMAGARRLAQRFEHPDSEIAVPGHQHFITLETGLTQDNHGSQRKLQYFMGAVPGVVEQPDSGEGLSFAFEYLKSKGQLRRKRPTVQEIVVPIIIMENRVQVVEETHAGTIDEGLRANTTQAADAM
ncbi:hypothetical protein AURDEDRAFT_186628 [Auricularia subglabra TFB-10046 SS5]|nr:hypothetical protein AURDEDRAFT_186628 [Auricularia subglabra TFB-10046 SS5]